MKQTLFIGEYSSRNVGDGIIKLAIEKMCLAHRLPAAFRDFHGGTPAAYPAHAQKPGAPAPRAAQDTMPHAPSFFRRAWMALLRIDFINYAIALLFYFTRYRTITQSYQVERYQQVVIGGGNLLMDNFLNFPLLILRIVQQCERHQVPVKLFSVGAGKRHSWLARRIMARIIQSDAVHCIVCRDGNTYALVSAVGDEASRHKIISSFDSGLYLDRSDALTRRTEIIGLGVIAPSVLRSITPEHPMADPHYALQWWDELIGELTRHMDAEHIELLSNGSNVDDEFARSVWLALSPKYPGLAVCTFIRSPTDLIERIGGYKALAAYRMHAAVTAMALDVPVVGFEWDPKVLQMFTYCGKPDACIPLADFKQHPARKVISSMLDETPARLEPIRRVLDRDFRHATNA